MVRFRELRYKNFLASGNYDTYIDLDGVPMTLIVGQNGAGKSTILDAICFCLFNKPFRKFNKTDVVNSINKKDCVVEVLFTEGKEVYKVIRGVSPARFEIWNGEEKIKITSASELQAHLEGILGFNHKSFLQIAILGKSSFVPFMKLPAAERRLMVEDLLDIQVFSAMNEIAKVKVTALKNGILGKDAQLKLIVSKLEALRRAEKANQDEDQAKLVTAKVNLDISVKKHAELDVEIKSLQGKIPNENLLQTKLSEMNTLKGTIQSNRNRLVLDIDFFRQHENCPTCKQTISTQFKEKEIFTKETKIKEYTVGIELLDEKIAKVRQKQQEIQKEKTEINTRIVAIHNTGSEMGRLQKEIAALEKKLAENNTQLATEISQGLNELGAMEAALLTARDECKYYEAIVGMLKDTGIKALVVKQYLPVINKTVNEYLKIMDFFVNIEFDDQFNEVIKSRHRDKFTYEHFSEGERLRIDLALLLTWRAVAKMKFRMDTNLLIMDEILDSSLDEAGMDGLVEILEKIYHDRNVFIISHKGDQLADKFNRTLKFEKIDNFSRLVE